MHMVDINYLHNLKSVLFITASFSKSKKNVYVKKECYLDYIK